MPRKTAKNNTKKLRLVVSDFHLGTGVRLSHGDLNEMEDFHHGRRFEEFVEFYSSPPYQGAEVELIFNGDMLNLIQVDYHGHYPSVLTEAISVYKMEAVIKGHKSFFNCLKKFLSDPKHSLTYIIGNHDQELMWPKVRRLFEKAVGREIQWRNVYYLVDGLHVEHGHQYEAINRVDPTRPFLTEDLPEPILNLPWGTLFTVHYLIRLKKLRPYIDKVRPFHMVIKWSLLHDTLITLQSLFRLAVFFLSTRFSRSRFRHSNLRMTLKMLLEASVFPDLGGAAKRILATPEIHTVVFGHTHVYKQQFFGEGKQYINTGTWTHIVSLHMDSFGQWTKLTYVRMEYDEEGKPRMPELRHWLGQPRLEEDAFAI